MLDTLWQLFLGSLIILAIVLVWIVISAFIVVSIKQWKRDRNAHH